ncbi:kinesin 2 [Desarmillaria tabescens]|uniref:Kinesin 2 n=1 Tax=Armillaria tabescens TaxID=1929756 RepID=A0AA39N6C9_ARMTA|nr:kinesin 2 [Desarmillaria tabescens]KAK0459751.1 kinesin 2 [Desarmillaria tabescens]
MATRRPPSSRSKSNNPGLPPPRSRSAMAKPSSPIENSSLPVPSTSRLQKPTAAAPVKHKDDAESNIRVVLRCRRRSEREIESNSPVIVTSNGAKSNQVSIETTAPTSTLGVVTLPPIRTYPFDLVFGPEADQALIYHEVVSPIYTMHGDLVPTAMGNPSVHAGMIPRVLFRLFHSLETSGSDFSVKISYIELLMSKDASKSADGGLKIFDDANKRGVFIQGIEEISVKDSADALALLTKGSDRRQVAATKFNDHSSRSHSIFSITVHTKENGVVGEDLLRTGKLNLVDLAGSENIGRSGAQNARAREAGMINQSLLTLGRVINALVDKAQHVPYRESKLTRLLQDSLGGRTKTCIIATVSPARSNIEETLSTLDYAMRAKSIRNKPEVNQRMTRNSLLKEYVAEIERLKADVLAAREKNGIFFSEETWNQMTAEQELRDTEIIEARKQVEIVEGQMKVVREEFEESIGRLKQREAELKDTKEHLRSTKEVLEEKKTELLSVKVALEEELVVRRAFQATEGVLDTVAGGLKTVTHESIADVGSLFNKLERKNDVMQSNAKAVLTHGKNIASATQLLSRHLDEFMSTSSANVSKLRQEAKQFESSELSSLASYSQRIHEHLQQVQESLNDICGQDDSEDQALTVVKKTMQETHETFKVGFGSWGENLSSSCVQLCAKVDNVGANAFGGVEKAVKAMALLVEDVLRDALQFIEAERQGLLALQSLGSDAANAEIQRLREQNEVLTTMIENERINADKSKSELVKRISGLLGDFVMERDKGLRVAVKGVQIANEKGAGVLKEFIGKQDSALSDMESEGTKVATTLEKRSGDMKRTRDGILKNLNQVKETVTTELASLSTNVAGSISSYSNIIQKQTQDMVDSCSTSFEQHQRVKRARIETTKAMGVNVQSEYRSLDLDLASTSRSTEGFVNQVSSTASNLQDMITTLKSSASSQVSSLGCATRSLAEQGAKEDVPTGSTPRRKAWEYVDHWELTKSRDDLLEAWRQKVLSSVKNEAFLAEHLPLPEEDDIASVIDETLSSSAQSPSSPVAPASLVSSASSVSYPSIPQPIMKGNTKYSTKGSGALTGTLTDARNVYTTRGSRRR